jgi:hypothetical protein
MSNDTARTDDNEPRVDVFFVKTGEEQAGVIVSFTDAGEEDPVGIYLYEPGADPVELTAVRLDGAATEFEYATVTASWSSNDGKTEEQSEFPGDRMVTLAQRDADVATAVEEHDTLVDNHEKLTEQTRALVDAVHEEHRATHDPGPIELCGYALCQAAQAVNL